MLPQDLLDAMNLGEGDKLFVTRTPEGILLRTYDETYARQMELAREVMDKDRAILRELAK